MKRGIEHLEATNSITMNSDSSDDDVPALSAETLRALQELREQSLNDLAAVSGDNDSPNSSDLFHRSMDVTFPEDWQMSQFWYDDSTSDTLAHLVKTLAGPGGKIACLSCPSVFRACGSSENVHLYEYDRRFAKFGDSYFFYDYNMPEEIDTEAIGSYSVVIADPPFLAEECLQKVSLTVRKLIQPNGKIILCTGAVMEEKAAELLGLQKAPFVPTHQKNLGNTFACFTNFPCDT